MDGIRKLFARIPKKHRLQLIAAIECLLDSGCRPSLNAEKLSGSRSFRIRAGRYRILFHIEPGDVIVIDDVRLRNEHTYNDV